MSRLLKQLPFASFEGRLIPEMDFGLAAEGPIVAELGPAAAGSFVHFVIPLPSKVNAVTSVAAIKAAGNGPENELTVAPRVVWVIRIPQLHLDDPPLADQCTYCVAAHLVSKR